MPTTATITSAFLAAAIASGCGAEDHTSSRQATHLAGMLAGQIFNNKPSRRVLHQMNASHLDCWLGRTPHGVQVFPIERKAEEALRLQAEVVIGRLRRSDVRLPMNRDLIFAYSFEGNGCAAGSIFPSRRVVRTSGFTLGLAQLHAMYLKVALLSRPACHQSTTRSLEPPKRRLAQKLRTLDVVLIVALPNSFFMPSRIDVVCVGMPL